ncbi:reverse transcriptase domain-containing protein [Tanacetum coccineum]
MPPRKAPRTRTTLATTTNTTSVTKAKLQVMIDQGVATALATRIANRSTNGEDSHNSGTGVRRTERVAQECTYQDFMKCQPLFLKGTKGVVKLTQWFERMEIVFHISNCTVENQIKFSTCTLLGVTLTLRRRTGERKEYTGTLPLCNTSKLHHNGPCIVKCGNCKKIGHMTRDCRNPAAARNQRTLTCYECRNIGHYRSDCPELKNQNHRNQAEDTGARGLVHALGKGESDQDLNDMDDDISA